MNLRLLGFLVVILGLPLTQSIAADKAVTVHLSAQAPTEELRGVRELSLIGEKGKVHPCAPKLGDTIELLAMDLDLWIQELRREGRIATKRDKAALAAKAAGKALTEEDRKADEAWDKQDHGGELIEEFFPNLRLILDGKAMLTLDAVVPTHDAAYAPAVPGASAGPPPKGRWYSVQFHLARDRDNEGSRADWESILRRSGTGLPMDVTLGILSEDRGTVFGCPTYVRKGAGTPEQKFTFRRVPLDGWMAAGALIIIGAFALFIYLALKTPILRDPSQPLREDGLAPISLGRCQMAFWFFLVAGAFLFLWLVTGRGDLDTITDSTLVLLGISAGTALGAAFVPPKDKDGAAAPAVNFGAEIADAHERLIVLKDDRAALARRENAAALLGRNDEEMAKARADLRAAEERLAAYRRRHPHQFLTDLLSEDGKTVTFHRFQIVVWTLVLGVVFVSEVLTKLAMPAFNTTLLLLMGISSGTYIGFKFTPNKPAGA